MGSINSSSSLGWPAGLGRLQVRFLGAATVEKSGLFSLGKWRAVFAVSRLIHNRFFGWRGRHKGNRRDRITKASSRFTTRGQRCKALYRNIINNLVKSCLLASAVMQNKAQEALEAGGSEFRACPAQHRAVWVTNVS